MPDARRGDPGKDDGPLPLHPLLLAAFPVLFLFAENAIQQVTLDPLWLPLAAAIAGAAVLLVAGRVLLRDWRRGAIAATVLVALFFSFGHVWNLTRGSLADRGQLATAYAVVALVGLVLAWRSGRWVSPFTTAANVAAALLVAFNLVRIGEFALAPPQAHPTGAAATVTIPTPLSAIDGRPDIYYIILDRYSSGETLERLYGFDNRPFLDELEKRGFVVADGSWANYFKTALSLTSSLNMDYLDGDALKGTGRASFKPLHDALRGHLAVPAALKALGYEYVHIGGTWEPTSTNVDADRVLRYQPGAEFSLALLSTTAWALSQPDVPPREADDEEELPTDAVGLLEHGRHETLFQFEMLEGAAARPGPTYVFAHVLMPHPPWRFNADGSVPTPEQLATRTRDESFLEHVRWTNMRVLQMLDRLLDAPPDEQPVIIVQADEGEFPARYARNEGGFDWLTATPDEIQHKFGILNAFHLPGVDAASVGVTDRISPANAFRIVFNAYFDAGLPLLPDVTWLSPNRSRMYDFVPYDRP